MNHFGINVDVDWKFLIYFSSEKHNEFLFFRFLFCFVCYSCLCGLLLYLFLILLGFLVHTWQVARLKRVKYCNRIAQILSA